MDLCGFYILGDIPPTHFSVSWVSRVSWCLQKWTHTIWAERLLIHPQEVLTSVSYRKHGEVSSQYKHLWSIELVTLFAPVSPCPPLVICTSPHAAQETLMTGACRYVHTIFQLHISFAMTNLYSLLFCLLTFKVVKGNQQTKRKIILLIFQSAAINI